MIHLLFLYFRRNLDFFENCHYSAMTAVDSDCGNGELAIKLPTEALALVQGDHAKTKMFAFNYCLVCDHP
jgi:hypothetical protein